MLIHSFCLLFPGSVFLTSIFCKNIACLALIEEFICTILATNTVSPHQVQHKQIIDKTIICPSSTITAYTVTLFLRKRVLPYQTNTTTLNVYCLVLTYLMFFIVLTSLCLRTVSYVLPLVIVIISTYFTRYTHNLKSNLIHTYNHTYGFNFHHTTNKHIIGVTEGRDTVTSNTFPYPHTAPKLIEDTTYLYICRSHYPMFLNVNRLRPPTLSLLCFVCLLFMHSLFFCSLVNIDTSNG